MSVWWWFMPDLSDWIHMITANCNVCVCVIWFIRYKLMEVFFWNGWWNKQSEWVKERERKNILKWLIGIFVLLIFLFCFTLELDVTNNKNL